MVPCVPCLRRRGICDLCLRHLRQQALRDGEKVVKIAALVGVWERTYVDRNVDKAEAILGAIRMVLE